MPSANDGVKFCIVNTVFRDWNGITLVYINEFFKTLLNRRRKAPKIQQNIIKCKATKLIFSVIINTVKNR